MRKSFTRLFGLFLLFMGLMSSQVVVQGATFGYQLSPQDGVSDVDRGGDFVITFNRVVSPVSMGTFALNNANGTELITMQIPSSMEPGQTVFSGTKELHGDVEVDWVITFGGSTVTLSLGDYELEPYSVYYITVSEDAIKDANGEFFDALSENDPTFPLSRGVNNEPDWDFTTERSGELSVSSYDPADGEQGVSVTQGKDGDAEYFRVIFDRPINWVDAPGFTGDAKDESWIEDGYFALYTSTDGISGEYGGNVVAHILSSLEIVDETLSFQFEDGFDLDPNAGYYLRVREDIIEDETGAYWDGINTNQGWNYFTSGANAATVKSIAWENTCPTAKGNIVITFEDVDGDVAVWMVEDENASPVVKTKLTNSNKNDIKDYVTFSGGDYDVISVVEVDANTLTVTIQPKTAMASVTDYTVTVGETLWDGGNLLIAEKEVTLTSEDYQAPSTELTYTDSNDGTTFDIYGRLDEVGTIYYIVVADTTFEVGSTTYTEDAIIRDSNRDVIFTAATAGTGGEYTFKLNANTTPATDDLNVWAAGIINVDDEDLTYPERITDLPQSHGRYYRVIYFAADEACGGANTILTGTGEDTYNISSVDNIEEATLDILPPFVEEWSGNLVDSDDDDFLLGCIDDDGDGEKGIDRNGPIYVKMNEAVERAYSWGNPIDDGSIVASIFEVTDRNGNVISLDPEACDYNTETFTFSLVPMEPFESGDTVTVVLLSNRIQDQMDNPDFGYNGTELLSLSAESFCVETYMGPVAVCNEMKANYWYPADSALRVPNYADEDKTVKTEIVFAWDQQLFVPEADAPISEMVEPSNVSSSDVWVGNYVRILKGTDYAAAQSGAIVHQEGDDSALDKFNFSFENTADGAVITVSMKDDLEFESETWYFFEIEPGLQTVEGNTLDWAADPSLYSTCAPSNYWMVFQSEDNQAPLCIFYEDDDMDPEFDNGILHTNIIGDTSYIKVEINEWVSLGYDGFKDLEPSDTIEDANALRTYFTLSDPSGNPIRFDVKNFSLDYTDDVATFYIDPYELVPGTTLEDPNFVAGAMGYEVCFLGKAPTPYSEDDIFYDDNFNGVGATCSTFDIYEEPEDQTCLVSATLNGEELDLDNMSSYAQVRITEDSLLTLEFNYAGAMQGVAGPRVIIFDEATDSEVTSVDAGTGVGVGLYSDVIRYEFDLRGSSIMDDANYYIQIDFDSAMVANVGSYECAYPPMGETDYDVASFQTIDGTAPLIASFTPDEPSYGGCLAEKDETDIIITFDEPITKGTGSLEIWRIDSPTPLTNNTRIASVNVSNATLSPDRMTLKFSVGELYNSNTNEICDKLEYDTEYFVQIPAGFVINDAGLVSTDVTGRDSLSFCVGPDPVPTFSVCDPGFTVAPYGNDVSESKPVFTINFSEPVNPVAGRKIQVSEDLTETNVVFGFDVSLMTASNGFMTYTLNSADILPNSSYPNFEEFEWGSCYYVNVDSAAFRDRSNALNHTSGVVTYTTQTKPTQTACTWTFCLNDTKPPVVKLWPEDTNISIPVNAHLYAYIDDVPWVDTAYVSGGGELLPLVTGGYAPAEAQQFFQIDWDNGTTSGTLDTDDWKLEFVGQDKQHLRITVYDPAGYDYSDQLNNPVMQPETEYTFSFIGNPVAEVALVDEAGNVSDDQSVTFTTEDIDDPAFVLGVSGDSTRMAGCGTSPDQMTLVAVLDEPGVVRYEVFSQAGVKLHEAGPFAADELTSNGHFKVKNDILITMPNNPGAGEYDLTIKLYASDDEEDLYDENSEIEATWMWAGSVADNFSNEAYDRIRDFLPAPNGEVETTLSCTLCDDDAPILVWEKSYPAFDGTETEFPLEDSIRLYFNEAITLADIEGTGEGQGYSIWLRDYENNIGVPLGYELASDATAGLDDNIIVLYPLDSAQVIGIDEQFQAYNSSLKADLESQRRYYIEIERYAISDTLGCSGVNYFDEIIGNDYYFETGDVIAPCLVDVEPMNTSTYCGVDKDADIVLTFKETSAFIQNIRTDLDSNYVYIYRVVDGIVQPTPHERIAISSGDISAWNATDSTYTVTLETSLEYRSGETYIVRVPFDTFKDDPYGNNWNGCVTASGVSQDAYAAYWTFIVEDYLAPVASWTVIEHMDYLDVVIEDNEYDYEIHSGVIGDRLDDEDPIATSSYLKVEFDEKVFVKNNDASGDFEEIYTAWTNTATGTDDWSFMDDLYDLINIKVKDIDGTTWTNLVKPTFKTTGIKDIDWTKDFEFRIDSVASTSDAIYLTIHQADNQWTPLLSDSITWGMRSNSEYQVDLNGGYIYDNENCDGGNPNLEMLDVENLVTIITRDDIPPTLDFYDGDVLVSSDIKGTGDKDSRDLVRCVSADGPLTLQFSSEVLKTPYAGIGYDPLSGGWANDDINWYTEANLPLNKSDLINPDSDNEFLQVFRLNNVSHGTSTAGYPLSYTSKTEVELDDVTVSVINGKTTIDLDWENKLESLEYYQIIFKGGTVKDTKRVPNGNVFLGDSVVFKVVDYEGPVVINDHLDLYPENDPEEDDAINGIVDGLWIKYDQEIQRGEGTLEVRWMHGQQSITVDASSTIPVESMTATTDDGVATDNMYLYIPLGDTLDDFESYYVIVPEGFVYDINECDSLPSVAINKDQTGYHEWVFHTADATPPVALQYIPNHTRDMDPESPTYGQIIAANDSVPTGSNLSIIFDENVVIDDCVGGGLFIYYNDMLDGFQEGIDFGNFIEFIPFGGQEITGTDMYQDLESNMVTFEPTTTFDKNGYYTIRVSGAEEGGGCGVYDQAGQPWVGVNDSITWSFVVSNDIEPMLASTTPEYNHAIAPNVFEDCFPANDSAYVRATLSMSFTDDGTTTGNPVPVAPREGDIKIYEYRYIVENGIGTYDEELFARIDINDEDVVFEDNNITVNNVMLRDQINGTDPESGLPEFYYVIIDAGTIINANPGTETYFAGIKNAFEWRFQTCADDVFVPGYEIMSPTGDDATNLTIDDVDSLIVTFGEGIEPLEAPTGSLLLYNIEKAKTDTIAITADMCTDSTLTVNITDYLLEECNYYVFIEEGALGDTSTVSTPLDFTIGGETEWYFHVGDHTGPTAIEVTPAIDETCVASEIELSMTFNETFGIIAGTGSIELTDGADYTVMIPIDSLTFGEDENSISRIVTGLPDTTEIFVTVPEGLLIDKSENANISPEQTWSFTTGENTLPTAVIVKPTVVVDTTEVELIIEFSEEINADDSSIDVNGKVYEMTRIDSVTFSVLVDSLVSDAFNVVTFIEGTFYDNAACEANYILAGSELEFEVGDIAPPAAQYFPSEAGDYKDLLLEIVFDDEVVRTEGYVVIYDATDDAFVDSIDVNEFTAEAENTFTYVTNELYYGSFYVHIDKGSFMDYDASAVAQEYPGINDNTTWTIDIEDKEFEICYNFIYPAKGAVNVAIDSILQIDFCEERIQGPATADRYITLSNIDTTFQYLVVDSMIENNKLTIPLSGLEENKTYSVYIQYGAVRDEAGNNWDYITDSEWWSFTTGDFSAPVATLTPDILLEGNGDATMSSSENGIIYLVKDDVDASDVAVMDASIADGKAVKATVLADVDEVVSISGLVPGTYNAVAVDGAGNVGVRSADSVVIEPLTVIAISEAQDRPGSVDYNGQEVIVQGVVTVVRSGNGFYIQDANAEWGGIYVYDGGDNSVSVNDEVQVQGTVSEYRNNTQISDDVVVTEIDLDYTVVPVPVADDVAVGESYESVRVMVIGRATETVEGSATTTLANGDVTSAINLFLYIPKTYSWTEQYRYEVKGVVYDAGDNGYEVEPVFDGDIVNASLRDGISMQDLTVNIYPNPFTDYIKVVISHDVKITKAVITNIAGQLVKEVQNPEETIQTSELHNGIYVLKLYTEEGIAKTERIIKR